MKSLRSSLVLLFACSIAAAEPAHWTQVRSPHFVVLTNASEKDARHVAGQLERVRAFFEIVLPGVKNTGEPPITVFALRDRKSFQTLEPAAYLGKNQLDLAGLFLRNQDSSAILLRLDAQGEHPFATVYHEYTHYMLRSAGDWLPLWLNEGLAEFFQNTDIGDKEIRYGQASTDDILYLRQNHLLPLKTILEVDAASPYYHDEQKGSVFYAESWALTHFLELNDFNRRTHLVRDYAENLLKHEDSYTAAQHAFGDLKKLEHDLDDYIGQRTFQLFTLKQTTLVNESSFDAMPISMADVDAERAAVLIDTGRTEEAETLLRAVLVSDPKNAKATETMGMLKFRAGDVNGAKDWFEKAVQLDPESYIANFYFASMCLRSNDHSHDAEVEADLRKAIQLSPQSASAYDSLGSFLAQRHEKLPEAKDLSMQAVRMEPGSMEYRMNLANVVAAAGDMKSAIRVMESARKVAKNPQAVAMIDDRIQTMQAFAQENDRRHAEKDARAKEDSPQIRTAAPTRLQSSGSVVNGQVIEVAKEPDHVYPGGPPGPVRHTVAGAIANVKCSYPTVITMSVDQASKGLQLFSTNYFKIVITTAGFVPKEAIDPCKVFEGMKAKVVYAETPDKTVAGQIVSVQLMK